MSITPTVGRIVLYHPRIVMHSAPMPLVASGDTPTVAAAVEPPPSPCAAIVVASPASDPIAQLTLTVFHPGGGTYSAWPSGESPADAPEPGTWSWPPVKAVATPA